MVVVVNFNLNQGKDNSHRPSTRIQSPIENTSIIVVRAKDVLTGFM